MPLDRERPLGQLDISLAGQRFAGGHAFGDGLVELELGLALGDQDQRQPRRGAGHAGLHQPFPGQGPPADHQLWQP
jgi:hypothetical protein